MPKANKTLTTLARLAMGTALLTVISGCENRMATGPGDLVSLPAPTVAPLPVQRASAVVAPAYVPPGAPTYTERSQAANVQTFESVYGPPVADAAADRLAYSEPYTLPSYDDGTVLTQSLPAPTAAAASYSEPVAYAEPVVYSEPTIVSAPLPAPLPVAEPIAYGLDVEVSEELVYGESVMPLPYENPGNTMAPLSTETYEAVGTVSYIDDLPLIDAAAAVEAQPMPVPVEPMLSDGVQIIGNGESIAIYERAPLIAAYAEPIAPSGPAFDTMPLTAPVKPMRIETYSLAAKTIEAMPVPTRSPVIENTPEPKRKAYTFNALGEGSPAIAPMPRRRPDVATVFSTPMPQPRPAHTAPVVVAARSSDYVSVGALPADAEADPASVETPPAQVIRGASIRTVEAGQPAASLRTGTPADLSGTSWRLVEVGGARVSVRAELHFDDSSAFAGGQGPCNSYGGELLSGEGRGFSMANIFATEMACSDSDVERAYIDALRTATRYEVSSGTGRLVLRNGDGEQVARFEAF